MSTQSLTNTSILRDIAIYAGRIRLFNRTDWIVYIVWVGLMLGLLAVVTGFLLIGHGAGVQYPAYVWNIPLGIFIFSAAIAFDTIGHRTVYKDFLEKCEALVHHITIFAGITSTVLLCLAYTFPEFLKIPTAVFIIMSIVYSIIDEALHWHRYMTQNSDRVEMVSHFFIFIGHNIMVAAWWVWYINGYPGVAETLAAKEALFGF